MSPRILVWAREWMPFTKRGNEGESRYQDEAVRLSSAQSQVEEFGVRREWESWKWHGMSGLELYLTESFAQNGGLGSNGYLRAAHASQAMLWDILSLGPGGWWKSGEDQLIKYFLCAYNWVDECFPYKAAYRKASNEGMLITGVTGTSPGARGHRVTLLA